MASWRDPNIGQPQARTAGQPIAAWFVVGAVVVAALVLVAAVAGARPQADTLPVVGSSIEHTLATGVVSGLIAGLLAILLAAAVRGARLRWLAHRGTTIDVADFAAPEGVTEDAARQLTLRFRDRLCELHLAAPGPQPGAAASSNFLQLIGSAGQAEGALGFVTGLLAAAWPQHAYLVQGALTRREEDKPYGVTIQVLALPSIASSPTVCWGNTYNEAVEHAANHAAAFILPRTRWAKRAPWKAWKGRVMPPRLVDAYERGSDLANRRRYDEALREFYDALELDPKNLDIRLRIGFVQEKMGVPLDALATYHGTCELAKLGSGSADTTSIARYRLAVILGSGTELAHEWCRPHQPGTRRSDERARLRAFLAPTLLHLCSDKIATTRARDRTGLRTLLKDEKAENRELRLCEVFQVTALHELARLEPQIRRMLLADRQRSLTQRAVVLSRECVQLRLDYTVRSLAEALQDPAPRQLTPLKHAALERKVVHAGALPWVRPTWAERYSAASLYALGIACGAEEKDVDDLATAAVDELREAVAATDSAYLASRRAWLVSEDPDLEGLRPTHAFQEFEATCFPGRSTVVPRPPLAHVWERVEYVRGLVRWCAAQRESLWLARLAKPIDPQSHVEWWEEELEAWTLIGAVAHDCEHRTTRLALIDALRTWSTRHGWPRTPLAYRDYAEIAPASQLDPALTRAFGGLQSLAKQAEAEAASCPAMRSQDPPPDALHRLCGERADAWHAIHASLTADSPSHHSGNGNGTLSQPDAVPAST
jgi:tetratricopeptide (TPR) repeat protein